MKKVVAAILFWPIFMLILQIPVHAQIAPNLYGVEKDVPAQWLGTEMLPIDNPMKVYGLFNIGGIERNYIVEVPSVFDDIIMYCICANIPTIVTLIFYNHPLTGQTVTLDCISVQ